MNRVKQCTSAAFFMVLSWSAAAHPHSFISLQSEPVVKDGLLSAFKMRWTMDEITSSDLLYDAGNAKPGSEVWKKLAAEVMANVLGQHYFSELWHNGKRVKFDNRPDGYGLERDGLQAVLTFTLPLATRAAHVVGVEGVPALVEKGRENAARNGLSNVTFFHENLEEDVTRQAWAKHGFDKVLLDPARAGAPGVMPHIIKLAPRRVLYVSCNPATLARDSETLLQAGYQIQRLAMLDMFPHTGHLESMVLFERRLT